MVRIFILLKSSQFSTGFNMTSFGYFCPVNEALKNWVILIVLSCLWGSSFILMKLGMFDQEGDVVFTDRQVAGLRMLIASAVLMPFALSNIRKVSDLKTWGYLLIVGFCGNFIPAYLFTYAETGISSGYTGMLNSFTPIFALLIGFVFFGNRLNRLQLTGVGVGTVGIFCLSLAGRDLHLTGDVTHILAVVLATICYAISLNVIKYKLSHLRGLVITSLAFMLMFIPAAGSFAFEGTLYVLKSDSAYLTNLLAISILAIVGTAFAVYLFNVLIAGSTVLFSSSVTYFIPIIAILIGFIMGEETNSYQVISLLIILTGIFIANLSNLLPEKLNP